MTDLILHLMYAGFAFGVVGCLILGLNSFKTSGWKWLVLSVVCAATFVIMSFFAEFWVDWRRGGDSYNSLIIYIVFAVPVAVFGIGAFGALIVSLFKRGRAASPFNP
jgi:hypothetical protein